MQTKAGTIVVGVDGSDSSTRALTWAVEQAVAEHLPLTLVHTIHAFTPAYTDVAIAAPESARLAIEEQGDKVLGAARTKVAESAPELEVHTVFELADPREVLLHLSHDAAMVVLGSRGRGQLSSLLLGSVGVAMVRHGHCPIVVHRPGNAGVVRNGIILGYDAAEESGPVLEFAYREASLRRLPLTVLHCYWDIQAGTAAALPGSETAIEAERVALAEAMAGMGEKYPDVSVSTESVQGRPQDVLVRRGERMNLIVVGAHQASRTAQVVFGSVSVAVVEHATCPVAVVPVTRPR
jgi:nucleotide-binding universal stress UspA family protein